MVEAEQREKHKEHNNNSGILGSAITTHRPEGEGGEST